MGFQQELTVPLTNTDRRLLDDLLAGHAGSWRQFVDRFTGLILQVIRQTAQAHSLKLSADDSEDLCAETFAELLVRDKAALRTFRGRCSLATWLAVITRRIVVRKLTDHRFRQALGHVQAHQAAVDFASSESAAGQRVEQKEQVEHLLSALPEEAARLLRVVYLEGCSYAEAALRLGRPENSIGPLLSRVRLMVSGQ
ncbi:MAG: RNA polymerase sigma factor [Planctomycetaceae bacterium]